MKSYAAILWLVSSVLSTPYLAADERLHARIDALIAGRADGPLNEACSDAEFTRRVYLDFAGRIPTTAEVRDFLADNASDKRERLIDNLLAGDEYPRRMQELFHVMFMERLGDHDEWTKYLRESFAANKPWDQMARDMLFPKADDEATRGAAFFITKRLEKYGQNPTDYPGLVRDTGRLFLGVDVQCAQCHDHLFIDDYKQVDFQGLFAFLGTAYIRTDTEFPAVGEKPLQKEIEFMSVFDQVAMSTGPRLPFGSEIEIPEFKSGEEYEIPPDKKTRSPGVLKFSPLKQLGQQLPARDNDEFKRNIVNRLWWVMMGRGLVDPLDLHHSDNPPSHPELLELLADQFAAHQFDIKRLLRELALTATYQRSSLLMDVDAASPPKAETYQVALERPLLAEQILRSILVATGEFDRMSSKSAEMQESFVKALGNPPREPEISFSPSVKAALFLSNSDVVLQCLEPRDGNLVDRLTKMPDANALANELYLAALTRLPTDEERVEVASYLSENTDRRTLAVQNLAWALLASTEFLVNH